MRSESWNHSTIEILVSTLTVDQTEFARLNVQSEDYSMILTTTTKSTEASVLEENGIGNE
jgi:hypothetical protein